MNKTHHRGPGRRCRRDRRPLVLRTPLPQLPATRHPDPRRGRRRSGLFIVVGFVASPTGFDNLTGVQGTSIAIGTIVQLAGVLTALVAGTIATARAYHTVSR